MGYHTEGKHITQWAEISPRGQRGHPKGRRSSGMTGEGMGTDYVKLM
ncbi:MAG: hypothetical protein ACHQYO_09395 [Halanaerobiales bacterium]